MGERGKESRLEISRAKLACKERTKARACKRRRKKKRTRAGPFISSSSVLLVHLLEDDMTFFSLYYGY